MGMTLKQAFTLWANAPRNVVLAAKSREAVQRVLMKKWNDIDLEQITPAFAERIFSQSSEPKEMKIKAASILVYLLQWGGDNGHCQRPTFDYTIANAQAVDEPETETEQTNDKPNEETTMEQEKKPRGKQPKPVAQIDPETLKVVKVWPSRCEAERQLGACNLDRCIAKHRMSAGFYWCAPEDADTFKPNPLSGHQPTEKKKAKVDAPDAVPASVAAVQEWKPKFKKNDHVWSKQPKELYGRTGYVMAVDTYKMEYTVVFGTEAWIILENDLEMVNEPVMAEYITKRSTKGLAEYTDDELLEELDRRGWEGELSRRQVVTIGAK